MLKGSRKDPFLCLGMISVILFSLVSLGSGPILKSLANQGDFSLATVSGVFNKDSKQDPFVGFVLTCMLL